jgi:hypothetical protein
MAFANTDYLAMVDAVNAATGSSDKLTAFCNGVTSALLKALSQNYPLPPNAQNISTQMTTELVANVATCITIVGLS